MAVDAEDSDSRWGSERKLGVLARVPPRPLRLRMLGFPQCECVIRLRIGEIAEEGQKSRKDQAFTHAGSTVGPRRVCGVERKGVELRDGNNKKAENRRHYESDRGAFFHTST